MTKVDPECLRRGVDVVKVQADDAAGIATEHASAARLLDQNALTF